MGDTSIRVGLIKGSPRRGPRGKPPAPKKVSKIFKIINEKYNFKGKNFDFLIILIKIFEKFSRIFREKFGKLRTML